MKEIYEFRINYDFANFLFDDGKDIGQLSKSIKIVRLTKDDPRFYKIPIIEEKVTEKYNQGFFFGWKIIRKYTKKEIDNAALFQYIIKQAFEPQGDASGTQYDDSVACGICGANAKQIGPLKLKKGSIPKKDISRTIAGEVVVSERFVNAFNKHNLSGLLFKSVLFNNKPSNYYQPIIISPELNLTGQTIAGDDPFKSSEYSSGGVYSISNYEIKFDMEVYKCPLGHMIGLNLLSEAYVFKESFLFDFDCFSTKQKLGVRRGVLRPEPIYICSPSFRKMVIQEKITGIDFEITHIG